MGIEKVGLKLCQKTAKSLKLTTERDGFSRLKSIFISGQNYENYDQIVGTCKRPILGNIPNEFISSIVQKYSKNERGVIIKRIQDAFQDSVRSLRDAIDLISQGKSANFDLTLASKTLKSALSDILPTNSKVILTHSGDGDFGNVFKLQILDNFGNKLIKDRALKIYKLSSQSDFSSRIHGINAEANSAFRFQHILGHKNNHQDYCVQEFFDLGHGFSISQFADETLPKVTSKVDYAKLGLRPHDFHTGNIIQGRVVDFGGIASNRDLCDKTVLKYYKKIMNCKNQQERELMIKRYLDLVNNPKQPNREKIKLAIELSQRDIKSLLSGENLTINLHSTKCSIKPIVKIEFKHLDFKFNKTKIENAFTPLPKFEFTRKCAGVSIPSQINVHMPNIEIKKDIQDLVLGFKKDFDSKKITDLPSLKMKLEKPNFMTIDFPKAI